MKETNKSKKLLSPKAGALSVNPTKLTSTTTILDEESLKGSIRTELLARDISLNGNMDIKTLLTI
jgi:hypothetical protein